MERATFASRTAAATEPLDFVGEEGKDTYRVKRFIVTSLYGSTDSRTRR